MNGFDIEAVAARLNSALCEYDADVLAELRAVAGQRDIDFACIASDTPSLGDVLKTVAALGLQLHGSRAHV
ncbi:hypothetical protein [Paraburkholderia sp. BL10I2N1]|uniref:hypothetical protein n=1 Tax=Paraburkholderia sp. BL10I2N1 TaxID=1938796 RepID=UPI00105B38EC|nr:hypothetical protein [Paraburkholderia sp. BL10I2N1]TDN63225.1 hypothetical protein B0G77_6862 [Paraburkholderia sp. BL10I2N1]